MDVGGWLRSLDLERYEAAFRENEIDDKLLPSLSAEDLKDLGVGLVGHRRKLLDAIAALGADAKAKASPVDAHSTTDTSARDAAERRQVTVMFSDLVGSMALSARMDPEDLREVISTYQKCVADTVGHFGGFVAKYMGDGVLVYFGYPQAHEDEAERAVRAGLQLVAAVGDLKTHAALQTRVGIATGLVVVGDLIGSGASQEQAIVGEAPNLAARLQSIAEPNMVVIAEGTRKLLGNLFELEDLGPKDLKGIAGPVHVWAALRPASVESRFEALHASGLTDIVGREKELELLLRRWSKAKSGAGQVVLMSGEAGIGKSRLIAALLERLAGEPQTRLRYFCSPQHTDSAFYPIIGRIAGAAGFTPEDTPKDKLNKLDAMLTRDETSSEDASLLAEMLSLPNDGRYPDLNLTAQQRRERTLNALTVQLMSLIPRHPVLMILEDAHWIDPSTLEMLGRTVNRIESLRVLFVVTFRPEFEPPWIGQSHVTTVTINRLIGREINAMIDNLSGEQVIPTNIRQDIIERSDGVPLFVEEVTKAALEAEHQSVSDRITNVSPPSFEVPATLHASLMARLDHLGAAKQVAQIGAAIAREFSYALLTAVAPQPEAELQSALDRLVAAGLLFREGKPPQAIYLFKHALVQDAAYGTLLREPKRELHARIAEVLESRFRDIAESQPELLARHCTEAGLIEKAASLWGKAGRRSLARSALLEAVAQLTHALDQIGALPATPTLRREQIELQVALITPLVHVKGYAAPETKAASERALLLIDQAEALGERLDDPLTLFSVLYGICVANLAAFNGSVVRELAVQFLALAEKQKATASVMIGHRLMGMSLLTTGDIAEGRVHLDHALALYAPAEHRQLATRFGQDVAVATLAFRSLASWMLGYPMAALADTEQAISNAREIGQAATLMYALAVASFAPALCGGYATAKTLLDELLPLAEDKGTSWWKAFGMMEQGLLLALTGKASDAASLIASGITLFRSIGSTYWLPTYLPHLAMAYAELGQFDDGWRCLSEAMTAVETTGERWFEAEVHRMAGEIALKSPQADAAKVQAHFERALTVARKQQAKSWELRAAMSMARLWRDQGKPQQARELLAPVYGWFTEGFDTLDLREAKALLEELAV